MLANKKQSEEFIGLFHRHGTKLSYKKGEFIIRPGDTPSGIFFIESGTVKAYDITKYGEENLLAIRKPGEIFPLIWTITGEGRQIIYEALAPTVIWRVKRELFMASINKLPDLVFPMLDIILEMYRIHSERILNLEYRSVRERLIAFLLIMAGRFGKETPEGIVIDVPLRHQDIASSINSSRETTSREMIALERKDLLKNSQAFITLLDIEKLRSFL
ncbi:MAG TPA: Crp/Fnr family transcriptional regulator [Candidatus Saccharimonadales bacterium]|nr:Crp/Fnr family transcriptional regulator [Candidatus Saccharimonadales bacterium]